MPSWTPLPPANWRVSGEMILDLTVAIASLKHPENPPCTAARLEIHDCIPGLSRKRLCPGSVARLLAKSHLEERFQGYLRIYTDWSVHRDSWTAAAAYGIPKLGVSWGARMLTTLSLTAAELEAAGQALTFLTTVPQCRAVLLRNLCCAIQCLAEPQYYIDATTTAQWLVSLLVHRGHALHI